MSKRIKDSVLCSKHRIVKVEQLDITIYVFIFLIHMGKNESSRSSNESSLVDPSFLNPVFGRSTLPTVSVYERSVESKLCIFDCGYKWVV